MVKRKLAIATLAAAALALTACTDPTLQDSSEEIENVFSTTHIVVYQSVYNVPNQMFWCAEGVGWTGTANHLEGRGQLLRAEVYDSKCGPQ